MLTDLEICTALEAIAYHETTDTGVVFLTASSLMNLNWALTDIVSNEEEGELSY